MLHPITQEFLSKAKEQDRSRQREVCRLRYRVKTSRSARLSKIHKGVDPLRSLLLLAGERIKEAKAAFRIWGCERPTARR